METSEYSITKLYYRYKRTDDDEIREHLETIQIVRLKTRKISGKGYYPLNKKSMAKILENPRGNSLTFDATNTKLLSIKNLLPYKEIIFLVKSSSRFFLKPDIGEVFDQIDFHDFHTSIPIKAICVSDWYETLPDTEGEHFLMKATLFK